MPNETVDAYTAVYNVRKYVRLMHGIQATRSAKNAVESLLGYMQAERSGIESDSDKVNAALRRKDELKKYGMPVTDTSDSALTAMGFTNETVKPDQRE